MDPASCAQAINALAERVGATRMFSPAACRDLADTYANRISPGYALLASDEARESSASGQSEAASPSPSEPSEPAETPAPDPAAEVDSTDRGNGDEVNTIDIQPYKPSYKKEVANDEVENLGQIEGNMTFGRDFFTVPEYVDESGEEVPAESISVAHYLGRAWLHDIAKLYSVPPMEAPPNMTDIPHPWQLKGAAQADYNCRSRFRGIIIGDKPGLGKTLLAILALWLCKKEHGISVVVCPSSLCSQWVRAIEDAWIQGHGMSAIHLDDRHMTAHEILASGYDVLVCSYEFVEHASRRLSDWYWKVEMSRSNGEKGRLPERPTAALASTFWSSLGMPIKRLVIDEAQNVNKRDGKRHLALKELDALATIMLSGTMAHNKWHDVSGLVDFVRSRPVVTHRQFKRMFTSTDYNNKVAENPDAQRMSALQRFLQAFVVARPSDLLTLPPCHAWSVTTPLAAGEAGIIQGFVDEFKQGAAMGKSDAKAKTVTVGAGAFGFMTFAIRAQLRAIHPLLEETMNLTPRSSLPDGDNDPDEGDPDGDYHPEADLAADYRLKLGGQLIIDEMNNFDPSNEKEERERMAWLKRVEEYEPLLDRSPRLQGIVRLVQQLRRERSGDKIVIFSQYLKALDLVDEALFREFGIRALRFDGHVDRKNRSRHLETFAEPNNQRPLLISARAGGTGLNLTCANIVIQTEVWWNRNEELQAVDRVHRQRQERMVEWFRFESVGSAIDATVKATQCDKALTNSRLMEPLVRRHDEPPADVDLLYAPEMNLFDGQDADNDALMGEYEGAEEVDLGQRTGQPPDTKGKKRYWESSSDSEGGSDSIMA